MITVIIPWQHTGEFDERSRNFEIVLDEWVKFTQTHECQILIGTGDGMGPFNRSAARNEAYKRSKGEIVIFADADTLFVPEFLQFALDDVALGTSEWALPYTTYYNADEEWSAAYRTTPFEFRPNGEALISFQHRLLTSVSGIVVTTRDAVERVHGYDERFTGWGYEDNAFEAAMSTLCGKPSRVPGYVVHLWHPEPVEERFEQPYIRQNEELYKRYDMARDQRGFMKIIVEERPCISPL